MTLLHPSGERFGELDIRGDGAELVTSELSATLERDARFHYRMFDGDVELLAAAPSGRGSEKLKVWRGDRTYESHTSPLRNTAAARSSTGIETALVSGGLLGLRYHLGFDAGDELPVAALLLSHLLVLRSRAFRATSMRSASL